MNAKEGVYLHCRFCGVEIPNDSRFCLKCGSNLDVSSGEDAAKAQSIVPSEVANRKIPVFLKISFGVAIASVFLYSLGIIPLIGIVLNLCSFIYFDKKEHRGLWMPIVGLIVSILYMLTNAYENGHLDQFK